MDAFAKVFQLSSEAIRYYDYNKAYQSLLDARACSRSTMHAAVT